MDGFRERLEDMGQPVPDERYEDIILQAIPAEYERVRTASYERRDFHLADTNLMSRMNGKKTHTHTHTQIFGA